jgi:hypothetical protein
MEIPELSGTEKGTSNILSEDDMKCWMSPFLSFSQEIDQDHIEDPEVILGDRSLRRCLFLDRLHLLNRLVRILR